VVQTNKAMIVHVTIENALKILIAQRDDNINVRGHDLADRLECLRAVDAALASRLNAAYLQAHELYGHGESDLRSYFEVTGSESAYEAFRYWWREGQDLSPVVLHLSLEIMKTLASAIAGARPLNSVGLQIQNAIESTLPDMLVNSELDDWTEWLNAHTKAGALRMALEDCEKWGGRRSFFVRTLEAMNESPYPAVRWWSWRMRERAAASAATQSSTPSSTTAAPFDAVILESAYNENI